ncbi:xanthine dehydrogenase, molybdenum binding subunit apoprotein [Stigmatella aurantiaca]|uniref:Xanthine dehydrogenase, molybdenum binding subunit apoprotein n=1 Tax=Stigmatella aurantiaca TaxID=41 RepID=A0A1H7GH34_STIAU|nr:xanthine dehydrogenase molybdopterin binding subunit [Stigmatella aurantiaca]SEK37556.1 xanthine dehydrogenase, molybdenum binding subunit apoprotein [Stigmatella aurantiaca]
MSTMPPPLELPRKLETSSPLHAPAPHESGLKHTSGEALYVDDLPTPPGTLVGLVIASPHAHARLVRQDASRARALPGVHAVLFAGDIPGVNDIGPAIHDEPLLADGEVHCVGQAVALVVAESAAVCRQAARLVELEYEALPAVLSIREAMAVGAYLSEPHTIRRGAPEAALARAPVRIQGECMTGAQDHFYLETQVSLAVLEEDGALRIWSSTQHPSEVQAKVAEVMGLGRHQVVVEVPRMGGGFGGKETQAAPFAAFAALGATVTRRPVKVWLNRDQDMAQTGKRHPFWARYEAGFSEEGQLLGLKAELVSDGGWSNDLSRAILDRALFHMDNAYFLPDVEVTGRVARTNFPSNTAFRGFGGPQGMYVVEEILNHAAERLGMDPAELRRRNFYREAPGNTTPYGQPVVGNRLPRIHEELLASSDYTRRREEIDRFNASSRWTKRGIGYQPVKFGISFTTSFLNQAGALVVIYADGGVQLNHGGTEMGQGLHTKMRAVCAHELGISVERVRVMNTATDKVPNTSATAASSGSDLNGQAVKAACETLRERLRPIAARLLQVERGEGEALCFASGQVFHPERPQRSVSFAEVTQAAYLAQVSLSATGYYRTPDITYDRVAGRGKPFHYFAFGAAVVEVEVSSLTGEHRVRRVDILHDVGNSLVPTIDKGQVEGGFVQGLGWLTCEEVLFDKKGRLLTHSPDTYKIPALGDVPEDFRTALLERAPQEDTIHGSKAVGEPPFMLAIGVVTALRHAIGAFAPPGAHVHLASPATPEAILRAVEDVRTAKR